MPIPWSWRWILGSRVGFQSLQRPDRFSVGHYGLLLSTEVQLRHPVNTVNDKIMPSYKVGITDAEKAFDSVGMRTAKLGCTTKTVRLLIHVVINP